MCIHASCSKSVSTENSPALFHSVSYVVHAFFGESLSLSRSLSHSRSVCYLCVSLYIYTYIYMCLYTWVFIFYPLLCINRHYHDFLHSPVRAAMGL